MQKRLSILVLVILLVVSVSSIGWAESYQLGSGDVLTVGVWGYEDLLLKDVPIRPDGTISVSPVGEVLAQGLSVKELTELLTIKIGQFIVDPQVTVNVSKFRTTRVYVLGKVAKPGLYELDKQPTLLDALGMAGSYTDDAAKRKIAIIHKDAKEKPTKVDLLRMLEKGDTTQNVALMEGDIIYLSDNGKINFARDILPFISGAYYINRFED